MRERRITYIVEVYMGGGGGDAGQQEMQLRSMVYMCKRK